MIKVSNLNMSNNISNPKISYVANVNLEAQDFKLAILKNKVQQILKYVRQLPKFTNKSVGLVLSMSANIVLLGGYMYVFNAYKIFILIKLEVKKHYRTVYKRLVVAERYPDY